MNHNVYQANFFAFSFLALCAFVLLFLVPDYALAGAGGGEFDDIWETLQDWTQGTLGKIIAGSMILVGIVGGVARQSLMSFAVGLGGGIGLYYAPEVIDGVMGATLLI